MPACDPPRVRPTIIGQPSSQSSQRKIDMCVETLFGYVLSELRPTYGDAPTLAALQAVFVSLAKESGFLEAAIQATKDQLNLMENHSELINTRVLGGRQ